MDITLERLALRNVTKSYPGVVALDDVTFSARAGRVHAIVGENGAGKSTLVAVASGAQVPDRGDVEICGEACIGDTERVRDLGLAIVRQEPALVPELTVAENFYIGVKPSERPALAQAETWARGWLQTWRADVGIDPDATVATLIPEQRFIVAIAIALASQPEVLVLDEPTEHLVAEDVDHLFDTVRALCRNGTAVIYISHRIPEVQRIADDVTVLRDGECQGTYPAGDLTEEQIVNLIVGRTLDTAFPAKGSEPFEGPAVLALDDLSGPGFSGVTLELRPGEIVGLAGIEDNGQRDLLRALAGLRGLRETVDVDGTAVSLHSARRASSGGLVYLPGDRHREGILSDLSVRENYALRNLDSLASHGVVRRSRESGQAAAAVSGYRVKTPSVETRIGSLSGGNQQKTVLASVLASSPVVLLADEPTQGVDVGARMEIYARLREVADRGMAVLLVSSDALEVAGLSDRVLVFSRGHVVQELSGSEVTEHRITEAALTASSTRVRGSAASRRSWFESKLAPPALLALAVVLLGAYATWHNSVYFSTRNFGNLLGLVATLALVAAGQQILVLSGGIDLSVGPVMGLTVVISSFFLGDEMSLLRGVTGFVVVVVVALGVGVINWALTELVGLHPMVATLATFTAIQAFSLILRPTADGLIAREVADAIEQRIWFLPVAWIVALAIAAVLEVLLYRSSWGVELRSVGSDLEAARMAGIHPRLVRLGAYVLCSAFAMLAGITLMAQIGIGDPAAGTSYTLPSIAAVVIGGASLLGGRGTFIGGFLAAMLLAQVSGVTAFLRLDDAWQSYLLGGMTVTAVAAYSVSRRQVSAT